MFPHISNTSSKPNDVQLQEMFATRNVIVAGETHGDLQTAEKEKKLLPTLNIQLSYEGDTIKTPGMNVTPDPPAYRLLYFVEDFYEQLLARKDNHNNSDSRRSHYALMDDSYSRYQRDFNNYTQTAIEASLNYQGRPLTTYDRLNQLRKILYDTLGLIEGSPDDASVYNNNLIKDNARDLIGYFDNLKKASGHSVTEPVMRKLRSTLMYQALQADLADDGKRIYKVGNNHVNDIRAQFGNPAWVIDEDQYKRMLSKF